MNNKFKGYFSIFSLIKELSIAITSTQNKENIKNAPNKRNAVMNKNELALKSKKKKSDWFCFICGEDRDESMV